MAYCSACGKHLPPDAAFCPACGKSAVLVAEPDPRPGPAPEPLPLLAYPHAGPAAPFPARPPAVIWTDLVLPAWQAAAVFGGLLLTATAFAGIADGLLLPAGDHGDLGDWLGFGMLLLSLGAGGSAGGELTSAYVSGTASLHGMPFLMTVLLLVPIVLLARHAERRRPAPSRLAQLARGGAHAGVLAALAGIGGLLATVTRQVGEVHVVAGPHPARTALTMFALVGAASVLARLSVSRGPAVVSLVTRAWLMLLGAALVAAPLMLLTDVPARAALAAVLVALPAGALLLAGVPVSADLSGGLTGLAAAFAGGGPDGPRDVSRGLVTDPGRWSLLLIVPVLVLAVAAVRHTAGRPAAEWRGRLHGGAIAGLAAAFAGSFLLAALAQRFALAATLDGGIAGGSVEAGAGPAPAGAVLAGLFWGAVTGLLLRWAPSFALAAPRLTRLAGRVDQSWTEVLDGRAPVPAGVLPVRSARWAAAAAVVVVVLAGAAVGAQAVVGAVVYSPGRAAHAYLAAVGAGNAAQALGLLAAPPADPAMLTGDVLRAAGVQRPAGVRTLSTRRDGDDATVQVSFRLGGAEQRMELALHADPDDQRHGLFPTWKVTSPLGTVGNPYADGGGFTPSIAGHDLDTEVALFPGRYPVAVTDPNGLFDVAPAEVVVLGTATGFEPPEATLSAAGKSRVADAVLQALRDCTTSSYQYGCPFGPYDVPSYQDEGLSVEFRLETKPYIEVSVGADGIVAEVTGAVAYTETTYSGADETGSIPLSATATVGLTDGELAVSFG